MDITKVVNKLENDYNNAAYVINKSIKYSFNYYNSNTTIYYSKENELQNQIILIICVNRIDYLTTIYFLESNNQYTITPYIPAEIYPHIRQDMFESNNNSPILYFERMCSVILNSHPIVANYGADLSEHDFYVYNDHNECPFFETFIRKNMSLAMKQKIYKRYDNDLAKKIIAYCKENNQTLRFTSDFNRSHDIVIAMN